MITDLNFAYYIGSNYLKAAELCGLSTDTKPLNVGNGSTLKEIDTGKEYMFDAAGKEWYEQASEGGGSGSSGLFVVNIVNNSESDFYTADKTLDEAIAAADSGKIIVMHDSEAGNYAFATYRERRPITWDYCNLYSNDPNPATLEVCHFMWGKTPGGEDLIVATYPTFTADSDDDSNDG